MKKGGIVPKHTRQDASSTTGRAQNFTMAENIPLKGSLSAV